MTKRASEKMAAGLTEAIEIARGDSTPTRLHVPAALDVKAIRAKTGLSQADFADRFGFSADQIKTWEQSRARPSAVCAPT